MENAALDTNLNSVYEQTKWHARTHLRFSIRAPCTSFNITQYQHVWMEQHVHACLRPCRITAKPNAGLRVTSRDPRLLPANNRGERISVFAMRILRAKYAQFTYFASLNVGNIVASPIPSFPLATTISKTSKCVAARFYQLASGHSMTAHSLNERFGWEESDLCWWSGTGRQTREHCFKAEGDQDAVEESSAGWREESRRRRRMGM